MNAKDMLIQSLDIIRVEENADETSYTERVIDVDPDTKIEDLRDYHLAEQTRHLRSIKKYCQFLSALAGISVIAFIAFSVLL